MKREIFFCTRSRNKISEAQAILLRMRVIRAELDDLPEPQAILVRDVIRTKAEVAQRMLRKPIIVEDTGLEVSAWNRLPGALVKWFLDTVGPEGLLRMMRSERDRRATAVTAIGYHDGKRLQVLEGRLEGSIPLQPRGKRGFGFDPIFVPTGQRKTLAELTSQEKNTISMRRIALKKLAQFLGCQKRGQ